MHTEYLKATHKPVQTYYDTLAIYQKHGAEHEGAVRNAFERLLEDTGRKCHWVLIGEKTIKSNTGNAIRPDGVFESDFGFERGFWKSKDSKDKLDKEIQAKLKAGYPTTNIIFEDSREAVLYQHNALVARVNIAEDREGLVTLLNRFFSYAEPVVEQFEQAVAQFREKIPQLAKGLAQKIILARKNDKKFQVAFQEFYQLCKDALNPNLREEAIDEMLIQHLLTERLFRTVFDNPDFVRRNIIAHEIEKVIDALTGQYFNRAAFIGELNVFYEAIEETAKTKRNFAEKQTFLNMVYERFFQGYSVKQADTHGIVYTPQPIVDFMCASVEEVLQSEFGLKLGDDGVNILDPATGTGNFVVNLLRRIPKHRLDHAYQSQLFANEVMLLPYYIASLNIEHEFYDLTGRYLPFEGISYVDTLDLAESRQKSMFFEEQNAERVKRQKDTPITVIIGNPPYNVGQLNENDNNKNRTYPVIDKRIQQTYAKDSAATNRTALSDAYVKFFRWAVDRLQGRNGIVCFVSNNGFLNGVAFDGFRRHLLQDFNLIYHFDFRGNARTTSEQRRQEGGNIFNDLIRVGVGITLLVKNGTDDKKIFYHRVGDYWKSSQKLQYLSGYNSLSSVPWQQLNPDKRHTWLVLDNADEFTSFMSMGSKTGKASKGKNTETIFISYGRGVGSTRDAIVYDFDREKLIERIKQFIEDYNSEVDRYRRAGGRNTIKNIDDFVNYDKIKWSRDLKLDLARGNYVEFETSKVRVSVYRPFTKKLLFFDRIINQDIYPFPIYFPTEESESENRVICCTNHSQVPFSALMTSNIPDVGIGSRPGQCFPFYVYDEDGGNRRENITDWALTQFRTHYADDKITEQN